MTTPLRASALAATLALSLAACARTAAAPPRPSAPAPASTVPAGAPSPTTAPRNWMLLDPAADHVYGISLLRAERELLAGRAPKRTVVVAVIDNGVDTAHAAIRPHLWRNPREVPGNGLDDDGNGFADDVRGWNFIGGKDGRNVVHDTYELTRIAAACSDSVRAKTLPADYRSRCAGIAQRFLRKRSELDQTMNNIDQISSLYDRMLPYLRRALGAGGGAGGADAITAERVAAIQTTNDTLLRAKDVFLRLSAQGITPAVVAQAKKSYEGQLEYGYNTSFDPRSIVGDDYPDTLIERYGNPDVTAAGAMHGTHVAGIIATNRHPSAGASGAGTSPAPDDCCGIASAVQIMALRAVPDGDERDKDIANAIRYAADNGAQVINMSFGKAYSPYKPLVDAAARYADSKGVLMVHAAGNDGANAADEPSFPTPVYADGGGGRGGRASNWIEVGASTWKNGAGLAASFSNYGAPVDVFAPGEDIMSTVPGGGYEEESGTSMASPVVAGLAALIMSYYPTLSAADVKKAILESATKLPGLVVDRPGSSAEKVPFSELSATGGIVNAYAALKLAEQVAAARR